MIPINNVFFHSQVQEYIDNLQNFYNGHTMVYMDNKPYIKPELLNNLLEMPEDVLYNQYIDEPHNTIKNIYQTFLYFKINPTTNVDIQKQFFDDIINNYPYSMEYWIDKFSDDVLYFNYQHLDKNHDIFYTTLSKKKYTLFQSFIAQEKDINKKMQMMLLAEKVTPYYVDDIISLWEYITDVMMGTATLRYIDEVFLTADNDMQMKILENVNHKSLLMNVKFSLLKSFKLKKIEDILLRDIPEILKHTMLNTMNIQITDIRSMFERQIHHISFHKTTGVFNITSDFLILLRYIQQHYKNAVMNDSDMILNAWCDPAEQKYKALLYWLEHGEFNKSSEHNYFFKALLEQNYPHVQYTEKNKLIDHLKTLDLYSGMLDIKQHLSNRIHQTPLQEEIPLLM